MALDLFTGADLHRSELRNAVLQILAATPANPVEAQMYYDSVSKHPQIYDGAAWLDLLNAVTLAGQTLAQIRDFSQTTGQRDSTAISNFAAVVDGRINAANPQPANANLTAIAALAPANDDILQRKAGAWTNRTPAQLKTDLSLTKADVGLANVNNTADADKPVSTAQAAADAAARDAAVAFIRNGVAAGGDDLAKLYALITTLNNIVGGTTADGDSIVDTVNELLTAFASFPEATDIFALINGKVSANANIVAGTKTKITYDTKGLVTGGADATTADISENAANLYYTDERVRDAVAAFFAAGTHSGITFTHNDAGDSISAAVAATSNYGKYSALFGNGVLTVFTISQATHGRAVDSTNNVFIEYAATGKRIYTDITVNPANGAVTIEFVNPPNVNQFRVHIHG